MSAMQGAITEIQVAIRRIEHIDACLLPLERRWPSTFPAGYLSVREERLKCAEKVRDLQEAVEFLRSRA